MATDRRAQLEKRRRRVLRDESAGTASSRTPGQIGDRRQVIASQPYTAAARADHQPRITDLIPKKPITLFIVFLGGLTVVTGVETLYAHSFNWNQWLTSADLASLDLTTSGSLATWFSSLTLFCAAAYAVLVFNIRRHKLDDYGGRYGLWLWATSGCLIASVDTTAGLHQTIRGALVAITGTPLVGDGSVWWIGCGACFFGVVAIRVALDMRGCPGACVAFGLAVNCYLLATTAHFGFVSFIDDVVTVMLHSTALLLGHLMLLFSFLVYARHVFHDAQGQIVSTEDAEQPKSGRRLRLFAFGAADDADDQQTDVASRRSTHKRTPPADPMPPQTNDTPSPTPEGESEPRARPSQKTSQQAEIRIRTQNGDQGDDSPQEQDDSHLSKAERRRLRKLQRRQKRAA